MTTKKEVKKDDHGLTDEQFAQWELEEINLDLFKGKLKEKKGDE